MKIIIILVIVTVFASPLSAQDIIITAFGDTIQCNILRMDSISVTYQVVRNDGARGGATVIARQFVTDFRMEQKNVENATEIEALEEKPENEVITVNMSSSLGVANSNETTRPKPEHSIFHWTFGAGYAKRLSKIPDLKRGRNDDYVEIFRKLSNGFSWESELQFFLNKKNALALRANGIHRTVSQERSVIISDVNHYDFKLRQNMIFIGPAWVKLFDTKHFYFSSSLSPGALIYLEAQWPNSSKSLPVKYRSLAGALHCGISGEYKVSPGCAIGLKLGVTLDSFSMFNIGESAFKSQIPVSWSSFVVAAYLSLRN